MKQALSVAASILIALSIWSAPGWYRDWKEKRALAKEAAQQAAVEAENQRLRNLRIALQI